MIRYLIAAVLTLWLSTSSAFAARETLLDFTTCSVGAKNASADCTPWTGNYSSTYAAEQFVVSANDGVTVYSDVSKQETASDSYCSVIISATKGGAIDWKGKNFEIVLKGTPKGRDGNSIKVNFVDGGNETFTFAPTRTYMDYGSGDWHLVYNGLFAYEVDVPNADTSLAFSFEGADDAYATLLPFRGNAGLQFIFK